MGIFEGEEDELELIDCFDWGFLGAGNLSFLGTELTLLLVLCRYDTDPNISSSSYSIVNISNPVKSVAAGSKAGTPHSARIE
jgi:hypothetical protein